MFGPSSLCFGFIDARVLLIGEEFEVFEFVEVVILFGVVGTGCADDFALVGLYKGRDDVADIHGVIFLVVLVLLRLGTHWQVVIFFVLGLVNQRALFSLLLLPLLLQKLRLSFSLYLEQVVKSCCLVVPVIDDVGPCLGGIHRLLLHLFEDHFVDFDLIFAHHDAF